MNKIPSIKEIVMSCDFDWKRVEAEIMRLGCKVNEGFTARQYAFCVTLNWAKKLGRDDIARKYSIADAIDRAYSEYG